jgi:D-aminopeptidase
MRARELGIEIGGLPTGPANAITDVNGIRVGHTTLVEGADVRTGVTVVAFDELPLFAGAQRLNGNGELTGLEWVRDSGFLTTPVALTNTHSVGVVRDALIAAAAAGRGGDSWSLPVVGETWDGFLNDIDGFHVRPEHVEAAYAGAAGGAVAEGSVGGGTGMICHGFKGGIGTASRVVSDGWTVGVLVQANHGRRARLRVDGVPVGERIGPQVVPLPAPALAPEGAGSIIVLVATDAPLLPLQCEHVARRAGYGIARTGGMGEHSSGDFALCVATGNRGLASREEVAVRMPPLHALDSLYEAVIDAVEESILNALLAAETTTGRGGNVVHALPHELLLDALGSDRT